MRNNPRELNRQGEIVTACNSVHHSNLSSAVREYRQSLSGNDTKPGCLLSLDLLSQLSAISVDKLNAPKNALTKCSN